MRGRGCLRGIGSSCNLSRCSGWLTNRIGRNDRVQWCGNHRQAPRGLGRLGDLVTNGFFNNAHFHRCHNKSPVISAVIRVQTRANGERLFTQQVSQGTLRRKDEQRHQSNPQQANHQHRPCPHQPPKPSRIHHNITAKGFFSRASKR